MLRFLDPNRAFVATSVYNDEVINNRRPLASHAASLPRTRHVARVFGVALVFLVVFCISLASLVLADVSSWTKKIDISALLGKNHVESTAPADTFANRDLNVLVIGSDYRSKKEYDETGQLVTGMRSDTTLVAHISADRHRIEVMSIPRDLMVDRPECTRQNGDIEPASTKKVQFNSVFALLSEDKYIGPATACTLKTVENLTGVFIDEFVVVDFDGFQNMVAALGGVHMCFDEPLRDRAAGLDLPAGCQTLDPVQALAFARARKSLGDGSDISRIGRQQQLIGAMMKDAKSRNLLTDLPALYAFLRAGMQSLTTSPTFGNATSIGGLALSLAKIKPANIRFYTLPFTDYIPDRARVAVAEDAEDLFSALRLDESIPQKFSYQDLDGNKVDPSLSASPSPDQNAADATSSGSNPDNGDTGVGGASGAGAGH